MVDKSDVDTSFTGSVVLTQPVFSYLLPFQKTPPPTSVPFIHSFHLPPSFHSPTHSLTPKLSQKTAKPLTLFLNIHTYIHTSLPPFLILILIPESLSLSLSETHPIVSYHKFCIHHNFPPAAETKTPILMSLLFPPPGEVRILVLART